jgi:hypothetical protein
MSLAQRISEVEPCASCAKSGGDWAVEAGATRLPPARCGCLRGRLLAMADRARAKRQAVELGA